MSQAAAAVLSCSGSYFLAMMHLPVGAPPHLETIFYLCCMKNAAAGQGGRRNPPGLGRTGSVQFQRNRRNASTKLTAAQAARMDSSGHCDARVAPSRQTLRRPLISGVSGKTRMTGCMVSGNRSEEKKMPERIHIGS